MKISNRIIQILLLILILFVVNVIAHAVYTKWDLTEEKRYTFTTPTVELLENLDDVIYVKVLLEGDFPAGFKRLQAATRELLDGFRRITPYIEYEFEDPASGTTQEINERREKLAKEGITPTNLRVRDAGEASERLIYPYALVHFGSRVVPVNLLEQERPGVSNEVVLNNSVSLLEYKIAHAIQKLRHTRQRNIVFTEGHGELDSRQTAFLETRLREFYATGRVNLDSVIQIPTDIDLVIIAKPQRPFTEKQLFVLDQYLVKGGNIMFFLDPLDVSLDSINLHGNYVPPAFDLNLDQFLFKTGARVQPNLVLDLQCTRIPLVVGQMGDRVQTELFNWYYHPLVAPGSNHPIVNNIDRVNLYFPASVDTIQTNVPIRKTFLLKSSEYARTQLTPVRLNFEILRFEPEPDQFDQGPLPMAVLLEGQFSSMFENRMTEEMHNLLSSIDMEYTVSDTAGKVLLAADGDLIKNLYKPDTDEFSELGYNKYEQYTFKGNQDFVLNAVEYMIEDGGILTARSKDVKLRMLDTVKAREESLKWQLLNICLPLVCLILGGILFQYFRKRRYSTV